MNTKPLWRTAQKLAAALLLALSPSPAHGAVEAWVQRYSHPVGSYDYAEKVATDSAGNVIVAGYTGNGLSGKDFLVIKYSGAGVALWTNRYNVPGSLSDQATGVAVDRGGNVFVTGSSQSGSSSDFLTMKYQSLQPYLTIQPDGGGGYFLRFDGIAGSTYRLERTVNLTSMWEAISTRTATTSGRMELQDSSAPPTQAFYRVRGE